MYLLNIQGNRENIETLDEACARMLKEALSTSDEITFWKGTTSFTVYLNDNGQFDLWWCTAEQEVRNETFATPAELETFLEARWEGEAKPLPTF